jgi:hypothetical protein
VAPRERTGAAFPTIETRTATIYPGATMHSVEFVVALVVGVLSVVVMTMLVNGQRKKALELLPLLEARGPLTLDEIAAATETGLVMKGYLMQALDSLVAEGKLEKTPPPKGHPPMRLARDTKYAVKKA